MPVNYDAIYAIVRRVPPGRVATYGQIARIAGCGPRSIGYALSYLKDDKTPWHRIINSKGQVSPRSAGDSHVEQVRLLEAEGVQFSPKGTVSLKEFGWAGDVDGL